MKAQPVTLHEIPGATRYDVRLPEAGLRWEKMGPLFERYSVALVGGVDPQWAEAYRRVIATSPGFCRFRLNKDLTTISFTCRSTDSPVEVMAVLKILEGMIERVNREASLPAPADPVAGVAGTGGRPQRGGLFARFALNSK